jgi:cardiolipin-specific phospholipase
MFSILPTNTSSSTANDSSVVLLHGYGAGLGFFYRNYLALGRWVARSGRPIYALDWLGMGRSARVPFVVKAKREDTDARVNEAEAFFVDSLEEWRQKMGLERMTLVGHSLGAYLSTAYALKFPSRVDKLVLLSPAGVPRGPNTEEPVREVTDDREEITHHSSNGNGDAVETASSERVKRLREEQDKANKEVSRSQRLLVYLWEEGWSPFQIVRNLNVFGPMLVGKVRAGQELQEMQHL